MRKPLLISTVAIVILLVWSSGAVYANAEGLNRPYRVVVEEETGELFFIQNSSSTENLQKPKVAVALGGGGARALVNVGILKALEEEGIPVELVVGSSMGAIVAVLYGSGMPLATIEELVTSDLLPSMFDLNFPFLYSILDTRRVNYFLEQVLPHRRLEEFPIRTALLSYDLTNGVKYIHTCGQVAREIQGSYSIPLFFPVVDYDGLYLMDPGVLELTPAQAAKVLGADVVISTTAFDTLPYDTYQYPVRAWTRFINILKERNSQAIIDRYSDVTIDCAVGDYSFMDYHLAAVFIDLGYREAQKRIPEIKQVLAEKGIPLRKSQKEALWEKDNGEQLKLKRVLSDLKYERWTYDFARIKPLIYFGRDYSFFKQELLREEAPFFQYGLLWQKGRLDFRVLTQGKTFDDYDLKLRWLGLTPRLDLIGKAHYGATPDPGGWSYGIDLKYYQPAFTFSIGWADLAQTTYLHQAGTISLDRGKHRFQGEFDLYTPLSGRGLSFAGSKYVASQLWELALGEDFTFQPKLIVSNTERAAFFSHPQIFRGMVPEADEDEDQTLVQSSLEVGYHYRFPYSLEILQSIQVKEVTWYQFADLYYWQKPYSAVGTGVACELNLLGIKPSTLGGYVAYDLEQTAWKAALSVDLAF